MEIEIITHGKNSPARILPMNQPTIDFSTNPKMMFILHEDGMMNGDPSVMIISSLPEGTLILQTSLDKFITAASAMATTAELSWGWVRPEGHSSLMPPDAKTRKELLRCIKKQLEEMGDDGD